MLKKIELGAVVLLLVASVSLALSATPASANKVDCDKVMTEVGAGKKTADIAKDLSISSSSVYRCKKKAKSKAKTSKAAASPMAAASPGK